MIKTYRFRIVSAWLLLSKIVLICDGTLHCSPPPFDAPFSSLKKARFFEDFDENLLIFAWNRAGLDFVGKGFNLSRKGVVNYREKIGFCFQKGQRTAGYSNNER